MSLKKGGIDEIVIVVGYKAQQIEAKIADLTEIDCKIKIIYNPFFDVSNNLISLWFAASEMDEDFMETIKAVKEVGFSEVQLNKYEDRPGTVSSMMKDKIPQEVIDRRYAEIMKYC